MNKDYPIVKTQPVARFYYKGKSHTHPVRRTVLITESTTKFIRGYELREGMTVRNLDNSPIKTFCRNRIARIKELDRRRTLRTKAKKGELDQSTLRRQSIMNLLKEGV